MKAPKRLTTGATIGDASGAPGKYRLIAELARGGMGTVYLGLTRSPDASDRLLVIKQLKPELLKDPAGVAMFLEDARLAACLRHPNVVQTIDSGSNRNRHYVAMEYLEGQSLYRVVSRARKTGKTVPFELQASVLCSALEGLAYAHAAVDVDGNAMGIVHRDMNPHNVFIGYDGQVKVLDFGIAGAMNVSVDTRTGILKGKVAYIAPEQAARSRISAQTDLFAVGVMLWEAATGRRFWSIVGGDMQILRALLHGGLDAIRERTIVGVADDLRPIILKATASDPTQRHDSAMHLLAELRSVLAKRGTPPASARQMGELVQELFAEDRAILQAAIEEALGFERRAFSGSFSVAEIKPAALGVEVPSLNMAVADAWSNGSVAPPPARDSFRASVAPPTRSIAPRQYAPPQPRAKGPFGWAVGAAVVLAAVGGFAVRSRLAPAPAIDARVAAADRAPREKVHVVVRASPPGARIVIDGHLFFKNPCVATLPNDGATHTVHVEADGYEPLDDSFDTSESTTMVLTLEPRNATAPLSAK